MSYDWWPEWQTANKSRKIEILLARLNFLEAAHNEIASAFGDELGFVTTSMPVRLRLKQVPYGVTYERKPKESDDD